MKQIGLLATILILAIFANAQTGKEFKKLAADAYDAKNYPKAFLNYQQAAKMFKKEGTIDTALYYNATIAGYKAQKYNDLIPFATQTIELKYKKAHLAYYIKAVAYDKLNQQDKYLETLINGNKNFPNYKKISKKLAVAYLKQGMKPYQAGANIVKEAEPLRESDAEQYKTKIEEANKKFEEARQIFEKAYQADAKNKQVLKSLLAVYQNLDMKDKAAKIESELNSL